MPLSPGTKLGPYEIVSLIGAGGMGEVYRARDAKLGRDVAIKVLPAAYSSDAERLRRFEQEAQAAGALSTGLLGSSNRLETVTALNGAVQGISIQRKSGDRVHLPELQISAA